MVNLMVNELVWDSRLFDKKIGELKVNPDFIPQIGNLIKKAKRKGFKYLVCKLNSQDTTLIKTLESNGFYISDIGVIWEAEIKRLTLKKTKRYNEDKLIKIATETDIPGLKKMITSLFLESRFYTDPFFSKEEANKLYRKWIVNSVNGKIADIVYTIPEIGFVTCKKSTADKGEIKLIGVKEGYRNRGMGSVLLKRALRWFEKEGINFVSVRTQLKNLPAMNFYLKSGFSIKGYDLIFSKIL